MILPPKFGLALFLLAIALPLLEIALMIKVAGALGVPMTLLLILGTGVLGVWTLQGHGFLVMRRMRETLSRGGTPLQPMIEGGLLFLAGWLLISPGFLCDAVGIALLLPPIRHAAAAAIKGAMWPGIDEPQGPDAAESQPFGRPPPRQHAPSADGPIIEGEFERLDERDMPRGRGSDGNPRRG